MTTTTLAAAALAAALLLSGCSGTDVFSGDAKAEPATTTEPTPTVIPGDENGDGKLSEREKELLAKKAPREYTLPDGSVITIDPTQPMPTQVVEVVKASVAPATATMGNADSADRWTTTQALQAELDVHAEATGKSIVTVSHVHSATGWVWVAIPSGGGVTGLKGLADKASFVELARTWANDRGYELIVFD